MRANRSSRFPRFLLGVVSGAVALSFAVAVVGCSDADRESADGRESELAAPKKILAIGDSITFGWDPFLESDPSKIEVSDYRGYAEVLGDDLGFVVDNGSCPGEASGSFLSATAPDNGCRVNRAAFGTRYDWAKPGGPATTQVEFLESYLRNVEPALITLSVGGNDLLVLQQQICDGNVVCIGWNLLGTINAVGDNLTAVFERIAATGYEGNIAVVTQYSPDYSDFLNHVALGGLAVKVRDFVGDERRRHPKLGVFVADAYEAFRREADAGHGGKTCETGLLLPTPDGSACDLHPSEAGDALLAKTVREAWEAARSGS